MNNNEDKHNNYRDNYNEAVEDNEDDSNNRLTICSMTLGTWFWRDLVVLKKVILARLAPALCFYLKQANILGS